MTSERFSRNEALFGAEGQQRISANRACIVGLGGLGSHVAQQLAYLGVRDYALIDFDIVTGSSMNRMIGAIDADVGAGTKKIAVAERTIKAIDPNASVDLFDMRVEAPEAEPAIASADVVFGCLDRDLPRLQLTELCARYAMPFFDLASDTGDQGDELWYGGRVVFANGSGCLFCYGVLDQGEITRDSLLPAQREDLDRLYGVARRSLGETGPMVVSLNGAVASLAVTEFMVFVTGMRAPAPQLVYRGHEPSVRRAIDPPDPECIFCHGIWGSRKSSVGQ